MDKTSDYLILFGDLVGSTEVAVEAAPSFFARTYIASFHWAARRALEFVKHPDVFPKARFKKTITDIKVAGDEVLTFTPLTDAKEEVMQDLVASAVSFAYITKLYWLAAPYNLYRMREKQFPRDIAVGIHIGPAAAIQPTPGADIASLHINVTKRIENQARNGTESRIFASRDVTDLFEGWRTRVLSLPEKQRPPFAFIKFVEHSEPISGAGVPKKLKVLELQQADRNTGFLLSLLNQLVTSPEVIDVDAERAAKIMSEIFLPPNKIPPFKYDNSRIEAVSQGLPESYTKAITAIEYIDNWFEAMKSPPKLFLDEPWLLLNCFFISSAMMRHRAVPSKKREGEYKKIAEQIHNRLVKLLG